MPVILVDGNLIKVACYSCIKGHRSKTCKHWNRVLVELRKPGRPQSGCQHAKLDTNSDCKCRVQSAYYLPGHQPRFATKNDSESNGVIVNAVEHPQLANLAESKLKSRSARPSVHTPESEVAPIVTPPDSVKHCGCCHHSAQSEAPDGEDKAHVLTTPAHGKSECETGSNPLPTPNVRNSTKQSDLSSQVSLPTTTNLNDEDSEPKQKSSCCAVSSAQSQTSTQYFPVMESPSIGSISRGSTDTQIPQGYGFINIPWDFVPLVDANFPNILDGCSCVDEPSCLCEGCRDHPRNPATMQTVRNAMDFQEFDSSFDFSNDIGDLSDQAFSFSKMYGNSTAGTTLLHQHSPAVSHDTFQSAAQGYNQQLWSNNTNNYPTPLLPSTAGMQIQPVGGHQHGFHGHSPYIENNLGSLDASLYAPLLKPTVWSQTRAELNPEIFVQSGRSCCSSGDP